MWGCQLGRLGPLVVAGLAAVVFFALEPALNT